MIHKISLWIDRNEDKLMQVLALGFGIMLGLGMMSLSYILR